MKRHEITFKMVVIALGILLFARLCSAETFQFTFHDNKTQVLKMVVTASSERDAMLKAGRLCYDVLTKGRYPGEEKGMEVIDICANPMMKKK